MVLKNLFNDHTDDKHYGPSTKPHYTTDGSSQIKIENGVIPTLGASINAFVDPTYVGCEFASNCYFDGTNWMRYDVTKPCHSLYHDTANDRTSVWRAAAAANPITNWVEHTILEADVVNGIAQLDANGFLMVKGSRVHIPESGGVVQFHERTSGERMFKIVRVGTDDYRIDIVYDGGSLAALQHAGMKNTIGGFSGLVAVPANATATGTKGQIAIEVGWFYTCVDSDEWERVATATW